MSEKNQTATVARKSELRTDSAALISNLSTEELAAALRIRPQTIRRSLCVQGHYMGLRPTKLPNRRLLWPTDAVARLLAGEVGQ